MADASAPVHFYTVLLSGRGNVRARRRRVATACARPSRELERPHPWCSPACPRLARAVSRAAQAVAGGFQLAQVRGRQGSERAERRCAGGGPWRASAVTSSPSDRRRTAPDRRLRVRSAAQRDAARRGACTTTAHAAAAAVTGRRVANPTRRALIARSPPHADLKGIAWTRIPGSYQLALTQQVRASWVRGAGSQVARVQPCGRGPDARRCARACSRATA